MNIGRHLLTERCTITLIQKFCLQRKASRGKGLQISYTLSNGLLQSARKLGQDASWINIMLTFKGNLQQLGPPSKKLNVGGSSWLHPV